MEIYPALDLLDGQCVRLLEGNFDDKTVYYKDPHQTLSWLKESGAQRLHLVDLSGAKDPSRRQVALIRDLVSKWGLSVQVGGGVRSIQDAAGLLECGVQRVVLGSLAVKDPRLTLSLFKEFGPDRITLALDVQSDHEGVFRIATGGWTETSGQELMSWIQRYEEDGLQRVLCTDIRRDGRMIGPNLGLYEKLVAIFPKIQFQASGGVSSLEDLQDLKKTGVHSVIVGKALYENRFSLQEALALC